MGLVAVQYAIVTKEMNDFLKEGEKKKVISIRSICIPPPDPFKVEKTDGAILINWKDPENIKEENLKLVWDHTVIVRNPRDTPSSMYDGTIIMSSSKRDAFLNEPFQDIVFYPGTYYYAAFAVSQTGLVSDPATAFITI